MGKHPGQRHLIVRGAAQVAADPTEQHDLSGERPEKLAELMAAMDAHDSEQAPPAWPSRAMMPINIDKDRSLPDEPGDEYIYWSN